MRWIGAAALLAVAAHGGVAAQAVSAAAGRTAEERTAAWFDDARQQPLRALMFLREMPKGGDLHSHLSGAVYAETYVQWAAEEGLCLDRSTGGIVRPPCDAAAGRPPASAALEDGALFDRAIDAMSVRNWHPSQRSGHEHVFAAFDLFRAVSSGRTGDMVAEVASRAALGQVSYVELMVTVGGGAAGALGTAVGWDADLERLRERLLQAGLRDSVARGRLLLDAAEARRGEVARCGAADADPGCSVVVRYQYQVTRARAPELVFAQLVAGFELASADPRVVGINMVQPEDHHVAMRDFPLHMRMINTLKRHYPDVRLTLHAGELRPGLVPPEGMRFHIRESIETGHASRIGHGTAIAHERDADALLRAMANRRILVEVALASNEYVLGIRGEDHPLRLYLGYGVPVALVTDDEGVFRSEMTMEFYRAMREHDLGYLPLKQLARNSLEYSFVEGASLWADYDAARPVPACSGADSGAAAALEDVLSSGQCRTFLHANTRARLQAELEAAFAALEARYSVEPPWTAR